jgi:hypothetical protein
MPALPWRCIEWVYHLRNKADIPVTSIIKAVRRRAYIESLVVVHELKSGRSDLTLVCSSSM